MSELISNKEALIALANGEEVLFRDKSTGHVNHAKYQTAECIQNGYYDYRGERVYLEFFIKPRTITLNGIEVPAPFEPKEGDDCRCYYIDTNSKLGYDWYHCSYYSVGKIAWRKEEEVKQVVAALRSVFLKEFKMSKLISGNKDVLIAPIVENPIPYTPLRAMLELIEGVTNKINSYGFNHTYEYCDCGELLSLCKGNDTRLILTLSKIDKWEDVYKFTEKLESL